MSLSTPEDEVGEVVTRIRFGDAKEVASLAQSPPYKVAFPKKMAKCKRCQVCLRSDL
jgi:hypothetical protein